MSKNSLLNTVDSSLILISDATTKTGLFICAADVIDRLNAEQEVDVVTCVQQLRLSRARFIVSVEQYRYLHTVAAKYISSTS